MNETIFQDAVVEMLSRIEASQVRINIKVGYLDKLMTVIANGGKIHQIGGYAYGRTSANDPFVLLYSPHDSLVHKICRVYPEDFDKLPHFIPLGSIPANASELNPTKTELKKQVLYHGCATFKIATVDGKDTQMGPEVRFYDVMYVEREVLAELRATNDADKALPITTAMAPELQSAPPTILPGTTDAAGQTLTEFNESIIQAESEPLYANGEPVGTKAMPFYDQYISINGKPPNDVQELRDWFTVYSTEVTVKEI